MMSATERKNEEERPVSRTRIQFDLVDVLSREEVEQFEKAAEEAHAPNLTEHFLNLTLRVHPHKVA